MIQLWKGKGRKSSLEFMRHLHIREDIPKLFQQILTEKAKPMIFKNMTKYQIAAKPGHRATEHVFVLMSLIAMFESNKKAFIITMFDIQKFYDRENIVDCMNELYKCEIKGKIYRLLYHMTENIRICV